MKKYYNVKLIINLILLMLVSIIMLKINCRFLLVRKVIAEIIEKTRGSSGFQRKPEGSTDVTDNPTYVGCYSAYLLITTDPMEQLREMGHAVWRGAMWNVYPSLRYLESDSNIVHVA